MNKKQDAAGKPTFVFKRPDGLTQFCPYEIETIHEYIAAIRESQEQNDEEYKHKSGAV